MIMNLFFAFFEQTILIHFRTLNLISYSLNSITFEANETLVAKKKPHDETLENCLFIAW